MVCDVHINDPAAAVNALKSGNGTACKAEFAVVIIFDDRAATGFRPAQQRLPPADGRHDSGGIMVGGGDVRHRGAGGGQGVRIHPLTVQRDGKAGHAAGPVDLTDFGIPRVLRGKDHGAARTEQLRQQQVQIFGAGADDDLLGKYRHTPKGAKVIGNGAPQLQQPLMGGRGQKCTV